MRRDASMTPPLALVPTARDGASTSVYNKRQRKTKDTTAKARGVYSLFLAQSYQRINSRCSTCGPVTREQRNDNQYEGYTAEDQRIRGADAVQ